MTDKIDGLQSRPVHVGTGQKAAGTTDAATAPARAAAAVESSPVHITDQARQLAALEQAIGEVPIVNEARVAQIRHAIERCEYQVDAQRIADKLLRTEQELRA